MKQSYYIQLLWLMLVFATSAAAQKLYLVHEPEVNSIQADGFSVQWQLNKTVSKAWLRWSATHKEQSGIVELGENQQQFRWTFTEGEPARFYQIDFFALSGVDTLKLTPAFYSTRSLSSGKIKVYFNHAVDHTVATETPAVYLNKLVDDTLVAYINRAKETIDIAIYNASTASSIANIAAALNNAFARGVLVRMVYDKKSANTILPNLSASIGKLASKSDYALGFGIMHNKFIVIDADAEDANQPIVWTGSTNWSVDQLIGPDLNNVIVVQDQALARAYKTEFEEMFGSSGAQPNLSNARFGPEKLNNTPHEFIVGGKRVRCYFSPSDGTNVQIIGVINSANYDLEFASMVITRNDIANAISNRILSGVSEVYGITDDSLGNEPAPQIYQQLRRALQFGRMTSHNGFSGIMHHKFVIADAMLTSSDPQVLTGSHNWSTAAEQRNDENTLIVHDADIVNQYYQAFSWMFKQFNGRTVAVTEPADANKNWDVFPNPAKEQLTVMSLDNVFAPERIVISDMSGRILRVIQEQHAQQGVVPVGDLSEGIYLLQLSAGWKKAVYRIVIAH